MILLSLEIQRTILLYRINLVLDNSNLDTLRLVQVS